jgi:hypothetical protein
MNNRTQRIFKKKLQAGYTNIQIAVGITVAGLVAISGLYAFVYIGEQKVKNEGTELSRVKSASVNYATQHGGRYTGLTLAVACSKGFLPDGRCTGTGAATTATNQWGGLITLTVVNLTSANTGVKWTYPNYSNKTCIAAVTDMWDHAARIDIGGSAVKSTTIQPLDDNAIITACEATNDDATIAYTFGPN